MSSKDGKKEEADSVHTFADAVDAQDVTEATKYSLRTNLVDAKV